MNTPKCLLPLFGIILAQAVSAQRLAITPEVGLQYSRFATKEPVPSAQLTNQFFH